MKGWRNQLKSEKLVTTSLEQMMHYLFSWMLLSSHADFLMSTSGSRKFRSIVRGAVSFFVSRSCVSLVPMEFRHQSGNHIFDLTAFGAAIALKDEWKPKNILLVDHSLIELWLFLNLLRMLGTIQQFEMKSHCWIVLQINLRQVHPFHQEKYFSCEI